jgi:hypothetical protein
MKLRNILLAIILCAGMASTNAQNFKVGEQVVNATIGLGSTIYSGSGYSSSVPPIAISYEKGFKDGILDEGVIGIGGYLGYTSAKWETSWLGSAWGYKYSSIIIGARGSLHYPVIKEPKLDTYAGLLLGYNIVSASSYGNGLGAGYTATGSGVAFSIYLGGKYYFTDQLAGLIELGYGIAYLNLGVGYKF